MREQVSSNIVREGVLGVGSNERSRASDRLFELAEVHERPHLEVIALGGSRALGETCARFSN